MTAPELVPLLVGEKWIPAVPTMMILASITPLAMLWSLNAPALQAVGRAGLPFRFSVLMTLLSPPAMWMGTRWGIEGVAAAGGLALLTVSLYAFPVTWKALGIRPLDFLRGLRAPGSATIGMVAVVLWTRALVGHWNGAGVLLILVSAGVVTYVGWLLVMHGDEVKVMMTYLKEAWRKRAGNTPTDGPLQFPEL